MRGTVFESGWYLPSIAELFQIWKERKRMNAAIGLCGGTQFDLECYYWSSSSVVFGDITALVLNFATGECYSDSKLNSNHLVCAVSYYAIMRLFKIGE